VATLTQTVPSRVARYRNLPYRPRPRPRPVAPALRLAQTVSAWRWTPDLFRQTSWPWIAPDIYAPPTSESFSRNEDPDLEAIPAIHEHFPAP
jgi:hypothetical protein